jgi:hypothetical protein
MVDTPFLLAVVPVEKRMLEGGIVALPTRVEPVELVGRPRV